MKSGAENSFEVLPPWPSWLSSSGDRFCCAHSRCISTASPSISAWMASDRSSLSGCFGASVRRS